MRKTQGAFYQKKKNDLDRYNNIISKSDVKKINHKLPWKSQKKQKNMYYKEQKLSQSKSKISGFRIPDETEEDRKRLVNDFRVGKIIGKGNSNFISY